MKHLYTTILLSTFSLSALAQSPAELKGRIADAQGQPLAKTEVYLFTVKDTVLVGQTHTDEQGRFTLTNSMKLDVFVMASCHGYEPSTQKADKDIINFTLFKESTSTFGEAVVSVAAKSTFKRETDRFVFVPKGMALEEPSTIDMLKHVPLLTVVGDDVSIMGRGTATIYINGRKPLETGQALTEKVRSLRPDQIVRVEVLTAPGASNAASNQNGIVNIVIRRNDAGWAGSSYTNASYANRLSGQENLSLRYGKDKFNASVYLNASDNEWKFKGDYLYEYYQLGKKVTQDMSNHGRTINFHGSADLSYAFNPKHTLGVSGSLGTMYDLGKFKNWTETSFNGSSPVNTLEQTIRKQPFIKKPAYGVLAYYTWDTDSKGSLLDVTVDHSASMMDPVSELIYSDWNGSSYIARTRITDTHETDGQSTNAKATYRWKLHGMDQINMGYEMNDNQVTNAYGRTYTLGESTSENPEYQGSFKYKENVQGMFVDYRHQWNDVFTSQIGLRGEYAYRHGLQASTGEEFKHHNFDLFPTVNLVFDIVKDKHNLSFDYNRSISRPYLNDVDPFKRWTSETTYSVGNPNLKPLFVNMASVYYTLLEDYIFNFYFLQCKNGSNDYTYQDGHGNTVDTRFNSDTYRNYSLNIKINKLLFNGIWNVRTQIGGGYTQETRFDNGIDDASLAYCMWHTDIMFDNTVRLSRKKKWNLNATAYWANGGHYAGKKIKSHYWVYCSLNKTFKFGGVLQFQVQELLSSASNTNWTVQTENYFVRRNKTSTRRTFSVAFSIPFGKSAVRGARYQNTNKMRTR